MRRKKVEFVQVVAHPVPPNPAVDVPGMPPRTRLVGVDARGRVWERYNDMPHGQWGQIEPPDEPEPKGKTRGRRR